MTSRNLSALSEPASDQLLEAVRSGVARALAGHSALGQPVVIAHGSEAIEVPAHRLPFPAAITGSYAAQTSVGEHREVIETISSLFHHLAGIEVVLVTLQSQGQSLTSEDALTLRTACDYLASFKDRLRALSDNFEIELQSSESLTRESA